MTQSNPINKPAGIQCSKTCVKRPLKNRQTKDLNDNLMKAESIAELFCNTFDLH